MSRLTIDILHFVIGVVLMVSAMRIGDTEPMTCVIIIGAYFASRLVASREVLLEIRCAAEAFHDGIKPTVIALKIKVKKLEEELAAARRS